MSEGNWTPGPWAWDQGDIGAEYSVPYCDVYTEEGDIQIADINRFDHDQWRANARLIAAAPDLYEALCDMVSDRESLSEAAVEFAKRALAKARGEQQ